jgi:hypothetical protein
MVRRRPEPPKEELKENEEFISDDNIDISIAVSDEEPLVFVSFSGFECEEDAEDYAKFLAETLPLLLFESIRIH